MLAINLQLEMTGEVSRRDFQAMRREAHRQDGKFYQRRILPRRFQVSTARETKTRRRTTRYLQRKRRVARKGGRVPNVFTGQTEQMAKRHTPPRATPTKVTVSVLVPSYIKWWQKREITDNAPSDVTRLVSHDDKQLQRLFDQHRSRRKVNIR